MQAFDNIFGIVSGYKPYHIYALAVLIVIALLYVLYKIKKRNKKPVKQSLSSTLREKFRTLEQVRNELKEFSVLGSMLIRELVSYKLSVDLLPLTTREIKDVLEKIDLSLSKNSGDGETTNQNTQFNTEQLIQILSDLDSIKYKKDYEEKELKEILFYTKDLLDSVLEDLLKQKALMQNLTQRENLKLKNKEGKK